MRRLCVGGPLDGEVTRIDKLHESFVAVFTRDGVEVCRNEYRHVNANPDLRLNVEVYAHVDCSNESALAQAYAGMYKGVSGF